MITKCIACVSFIVPQDEEGGEEYNESDSEDEETVLYNPKNLPLGWDGKVRKNGGNGQRRWPEDM